MPMVRMNGQRDAITPQARQARSYSWAFQQGGGVIVGAPPLLLPCAPAQHVLVPIATAGGLHSARVGPTQGAPHMSLLAQLGRTGAKRLVRACRMQMSAALGGPPSSTKTSFRRTLPHVQAPAGARVLSQTEQFRQFAATPAPPAAQGGCCRPRAAATPLPCGFIIVSCRLGMTCECMHPADEDVVLTAFRQSQQQYQQLMSGLQVRPRAAGSERRGLRDAMLEMINHRLQSDMCRPAEHQPAPDWRRCRHQEVCC